MSKSILIAGCGFIGRTLQRNVDAPSEPAKVENKIIDPRRGDGQVLVQ